MEIKKLIVTGCRGFIATNFLNLLAESNRYEYYGIDALYKGANTFETNGTKNLAKEYNLGLTNDLLYDELETDFGDFKNTCVVHFAAFSHVDDSIINPIKLVSININATHRLAEFCARKNIPFILISTDEVLGSITDEQMPLREEAKLKPRNPYSYSKAACELLVQSLSEQYPSWNYRITRCVNNFGLYQDPTKLIPVCINKILNKEKIPVYGEGLQKRSWIYVGLHNQIVLDIINDISNYYIDNHIYHIGSDYEFKNIDLITKICYMMEVNPKQYIQFIKDPRGFAHDYRYSLSSDKIKNKFPDRSLHFSFDDTLKSVIEFYSNNKNKNMWY